MATAIIIGFSEITGQHFIQTGEAAGLAKSLVREAIEEMADVAPKALKTIEDELPAGFPESIHVAVREGLLARLDHLEVKRGVEARSLTRKKEHS